VAASYEHASVIASSRKKGDDRALVIEHGGALVAVIADGAGGLTGGAGAADAVVEAVRAALDGGDCNVASGPRWAELLAVIDERFAAARAGETTAVVIAVGPGGVAGAAAGDSEAWIVHRDEVDDLTAGQKSKRIGSGRAAPLAFRRPELRGVLVMGSDGVFAYARADRIVGATRGRAPPEIAAGLVDLVRLPSGEFADDVGVVAAGTRERGLNGKTGRREGLMVGACAESCVRERM
jgi:serine/threonine protein phosphatase PrpC